MNTLDQQRLLVDKLCQLTSSDKLDWVEDSNGSVFSSLNGFNVVLSEGANAGGGTVYVISIEDGGKNKIESFNDEDIENGDSTYFRRMGNLFKDAVRQARGANKALDQILKKLDDLS